DGTVVSSVFRVLRSPSETRRPLPSIEGSGRRTATCGSAEQRVHERLRLEGSQIVGTFAEADALHGYAEFVLHLEDDAALRGAVEFGQHDTGDVDDLGEHAGLHQSVLADGRIENQED